MEKNKLLKPYETDASQIQGKALDVIFPSSIAEVSQAVRLNKKITIRGGGTGLAGGAVPQRDVVLDLSKLNHIISLDNEKKTVEVEAGIILDELNNFLNHQELEFPVNPSSHEVCTIGGMIATDAVGNRAGKYGKTSKWVNWIEIMDSNGNLQKKSRTEISDYTGMEGITGVIVKASLKLTNKKERTATLIPEISLNYIIKLVREYKRNPHVSMIEFLNKQISEWLGLERKYHLIVEFESNQGELDGKEYENLLKLRDSIYPVLAKKGYCKIEDPKILLDRFDKIMPWFEDKKIPVFGHLSVGIIHPCLNESQEKHREEMMALVKKLHGQITGEHGIGLLKKNFIEPNDKKILLNIKKRTDPQNKFNHGKVV